MPNKFSLQAVQLGLNKSLSADDAKKALIEINRLANAEEEGKPEREKPVKKTFTVIRPDDTTEVCWVVSHPEDMPAAVVPEKIREAISAYNSSKKGQMKPCASFGEGIEDVPAKFFKEFQISIRTKLPVELLATGRGIELAGDGQVEMRKVI